MRPTPLPVERFRVQLKGWETEPNVCFGCFKIPFVRRTGTIVLNVISSDGNFVEAGLGPDYAWEHVGVSRPASTPTWEMMSFIKDCFWLPGEAVMQLHVPRSRHLNLHEHCLHLWRPIGREIPLPPNDTVA